MRSREEENRDVSFETNEIVVSPITGLRRKVEILINYS